ncbi:MAG: hypothetical protein IPH07_21110 [Deltaproteobacteria bacterium]|jgi:hypothetical protein|nr:hypothetical protein [Deltaproteobacteria bacterium]MBK8239808.1 hypothetical protein [Deltaproteobacteria bacterium]MBK8714544.1 hypothetical protein [Deltaproteobacteria bacterium]MBP7289423.1 hypothetical protein [Nannocystaceae bacterium]
MKDATNPVIIEREVEAFAAAWRERLEDASLRTRELVVRHPLAAVGSALGLGFLLARLFRR